MLSGTCIFMTADVNMIELDQMGVNMTNGTGTILL